MGCNHPLKGFKTGYLTDNGKDEFLIMPGTSGDIVDAELANSKKRVNPAVVKFINGHGYLTDPIPIPCGHCEGCVKAIRSKWRDRMVLEAASLDPSNQECYFITLTYRDECLPALKTGELALKERDVTLFLKRLRKLVKFRFYLCGEYGDLGKRPHYHMVYFGDRLPLKWFGINRAKCDLVENAWSLGLVDVSLADVACMAYVAGYVTKKMKPSDDPPSVPEFQRMSRRPGIGIPYALGNLDVLPSGLVYGAFSDRRRYSAMPRLFEKFLSDEDLKALKEKRIKAGRDRLRIMEYVFHTQDEDLIGNYLDEILIKERASSERRDLS